MLSHDWDPGPEGEALRAEAAAMVEAAAGPDLFAPRCQAWAAFFEAEKRGETDRRGRGHLATALAFLKTGWAEKAMAAGWGEVHLFGLHPTRPWDRLDAMGAAYLAKAPVAVTADTIALASGLTCRPKGMVEACLPGPHR